MQGSGRNQSGHSEKLIASTMNMLYAIIFPGERGLKVARGTVPGGRGVKGGWGVKGGGGYARIHRNIMTGLYTVCSFHRCPMHSKIGFNSAYQCDCISLQLVVVPIILRLNATATRIHHESNYFFQIPLTD